MAWVGACPRFLAGSPFALRICVLSVTFKFVWLGLDEHMPTWGDVRNNSKSKWWQTRRTSRKSKTHYREWKTEPISACQCLIQDILRGEYDLLSFQIFVSKFEGWKGRYFYGRPRAALSLAKPLSPWSLNATQWFKIFHNDASTSWSKKIFSSKKRETPTKRLKLTEHH